MKHEQTYAYDPRGAHAGCELSLFYGSYLLRSLPQHETPLGQLLSMPALYTKRRIYTCHLKEADGLNPMNH